MNEITPRRDDVSRRDVLLGGLALGGLLLSGCASQNAGLPGPRYPFEGGASTGPEVARKNAVNAAALPAKAKSVEAPTGIIARSQWTRSGIARPREAHWMDGINRITVHHDSMVSSDLRSTSEVARRIESIRKSHVEKGWADIGYHYVIDPQGRIWEARAIDRQGAHVEDNNEHNLGVVLLGNFDVQAPTSAATASLERFVAAQMRRYRVPPSRVYTHRELKPTRCPGDRLQRFMLGTRGRGGELFGVAV